MIHSYIRTLYTADTCAAAHLVDFRKAVGREQLVVVARETFEPKNALKVHV